MIALWGMIAALAIALVALVLGFICDRESR